MYNLDRIKGKTYFRKLHERVQKIIKELEIIMSERAYSEELKREISALEAHKKSLTNELKSAKAFRCQDPACKIGLTCSNWNVADAKRIFFTPSSRNNLHSIICSTISIEEEKKQIEIETDEGKKTICKSGIISMKKTKERAKSIDMLKGDKEDFDVENRRARNNVRIDKTGVENRNISSIKTYVNFYYDEEVNNNAPIFEVDGEIINLNTLFVDAKNEVKEGITRIFYGKAILSTPDFNSDLISIEFVDSEKPCIYTNKKQLFTRISSRIVNRYLDTGIEADLFFRGCINNSGKFESFNGKFYCDLHIKE